VLEGRRQRGSAESWMLKVLKALYDSAGKTLQNEDILAKVNTPEEQIHGTQVFTYVNRVATEFPDWVRHDGSAWRAVRPSDRMLDMFLAELPDYAKRWQTDEGAKDAVAAYLARTFRPGAGAWLALDASSTVARIAWFLLNDNRHETPLRNLKVVTNNLLAAWWLTFLGRPAIEELHLVGGEVNATFGALLLPPAVTTKDGRPPRSLTCVDHIFRESTAAPAFEKAYLGCDHISFDKGLYCNDADQIPYKRQLIEMATAVYIPVPPLKIGLPEEPTGQPVMSEAEWRRVRPKAWITTCAGTTDLFTGEEKKWVDALGQDRFRLV